jgi:peptide/nickel transport system permease protein
VKRFVFRRLVFAIMTLIAATLIVFVLSRVAGDPLLLYAKPGGYGMSPERVEALSHKLGLDRPLIIQYFMWMGRVLRGDLGNTIVSETPVSTLIADRIWFTVQLGVIAFMLSLAIGIPLGVLSAVKRGSVWDYAGRTFALAGQATPAFLAGMMAILVFSIRLDWFPVGGTGPDAPWWTWTKLKYFVLPSVTLGWMPAAAFLRLTRSAMLEVLDSEYIKLARAKGVSSNKIIWKHAFKNAALQPLTLAAVTLAGFITGAVVIERVFNLPGVGELTVNAVWNTDFPTITSTVLLWTGLFVFMNLLADLTYAYLDPRIRYS